MTATGRPVPAPDRDSGPWWEALAAHQLTLQECEGCANRRWPPRALCNQCGSLSWRWVPATGRGNVASWIVNHHRFFAAMSDPSVVVLVRLDDAAGVLMPGGWAGAQDGSGLAVGLGVEVGYEDVIDGTGGSRSFTLLRWRPANPG